MKPFPSLKGSFPQPFKGNEIWYSNLAGLKTNRDRLLAGLKDQEEHICSQKPNSMLIEYHLLDTNISYDLAKQIAESLIRCQEYIKKVAIIGLSIKGRWYLNWYLRLSGKKIAIPTKYFYNFDHTKNWLVGEKD